MTTLALDFSRRSTFVIALVEEGTVIWHARGTGGSQDEAVGAALDELSPLLTRDVTDAVLTSGPGSYTGLRIGASLAGGLAAVRKMALHPVDSFLPLALAARSAFGPGTYTVLCEAGRGAYYACDYRASGTACEPAGPVVRIAEGDLDTLDGHTAIAYGDGHGARVRPVDHLEALALVAAEGLARPAFPAGEIAFTYHEPAGFAGAGR